MDLTLTAAIYALLGDVFATFLAATLAVSIRHQANRKAFGVLLGSSAGFILGVAFFDLVPEAQKRSHDNIAIGLGIIAGICSYWW